MEPKFIRVRGAREHNLKNVDVDIPKNQLVVITGLSGSGKSSLAFDTVYAEGQRRYVESLSAYARQFLELMQKPDVDLIEGLSPAISIEQKTTSKNPRSTVGTTTEIYDYLRLLYARVGIPYSPATGLPITSQTVSQMVDGVMQLPEGTRLLLMAPLVRQRKGEFRKELTDLRKRGFQRVKIDGTIYELDDIPILSKTHKHDIDVIVDRVIVRPELQNRLADTFEVILNLAEGLAVAEEADTGKRHLFSSRFACPVSGFSIEEIEPRLFSFNSPMGACPRCDGLGVQDPFQSALEKANAFLNAESEEREEFDFDAPFSSKVCPTCQGDRLKPEALAVKIGQRTIAEICKLPIHELSTWFKHIKAHFTPKEKEIAARLLKEIEERLHFLVNVGLDYLTLARTSGTLSGGESQRIRLASQIGSQLTGVLYVLDEPSIGLHQRDNDRLLQTLHHLRDLGNTVLVVEHDEDTIRAADHIIDMGPQAGIHGGTVVAAGTAQDIINSKSLTGQYLDGSRLIAIPRQRRTASQFLTLKGARANNLQDVTVSIPLANFVCVTGVSGSGKSSLIMETLYPALAKSLHRAQAHPGEYTHLEGLPHIDKVININQQPIGRTPRSNPATYVGVFTPIREWYAGLPEAKARGYNSGRFSFNIRGGRCEACQGDGVLKIEMHFVPDVYVVCDQCHGQRYNRETLEIKFKGKSIADILALTVEEGLEFFAAIPSIAHRLYTLQQVGLGYVKIGQSATTLSGGEAQRVKLAKELARRNTGRTFYILDEPTTGLHFEDVRHLLEILHALVDQGNTVLVIEHNLEVIKTADWILDLGPEGGEGGGHLIATGTPEEVATVTTSYTGQYLQRCL